MMIFTHMLMGAFLGMAVALLYPDFLTIAVFAGFIGGAFPDFDMIFTHRRTLHYPFLSPIATIAAGYIVYLWANPILIGIFSFTLAVTAHSLSDILGGGKEMRPWLETDDRAVYNHVTRKWIKARRVFYDGSVVDLGISVFLTAVLILTLPTQFSFPFVVILSLSIVYAGLRRWITRHISDDYQTFSEFIQHKLGLAFNQR